MPPNFPPNTYPNLLPSLPANLLSPTTTEHLHHTIRILTRLREHLAERLALSELDDGMRDTRFYIEVVDVLDEVEECGVRGWEMFVREVERREGGEREVEAWRRRVRTLCLGVLGALGDEVENCRTVTERKGIGRDEGVRRECRQVARPCGVDELGGERRMVGVEIEMGEARNRKVKVELGGESNKTVEVNLDERSNKKVEAQVEVGLGGSDDGVSPPLNTSTITADDSLPLGRKILNESFNYPPLLCREEIDSEEQEDKEMRRLEESSFDSSAASPQSWTPSPPLGSKIDSLPPHIQISLPLGFTLPSHSSHVPELRFPTGATVFSFPKPTTRSEVAALLKRLQQHGRVSPIFRAHEEPSILQIRTRAMASKIRKAIQEMSGEKLFGDDPVPIDFDDKWSEEKQGYTFIISDLDIAFQASHSQKDESKESQNPANQMYILEELEQDLRLRGGFGDEGYENSIDYEESSNGIASEGSVPDDALLLQPRQFFYPHTNTPTSLDGMRASYFSQIFPSYERAWVEEVRRLERAYSRLRIQFLSLKREHFHCKSSPKALEGRSWHLEAKLEGCKRAREDANLRAIAAQRRLELIKNPLLAYQTPISEMQDRASRVDRLLQQVEEKHKPTDKTRLRGGGQRGTAEQRPTSQHGHHRTPKDCKPTQQEVKARGFIWHAALSTVIVSPSLHYQWARNTTLAQLRQILAYRAEHNIEDDMILRRIRHILEVRSQRSVPDPDTSQGQIVYIGLLDDPDCEYERSRAVQGEFPIWNFEGHSDDSSRDLDEEDWKMGLFHTFNVLRRHQARHGPESCVGSSTYGSADDEFPSFADVIIQLQGEVDSETGSYRSDKSFASPGMGSGNEDSDSFDIHHMDVRGYIKLMRFARDDPLYTTLLSADSPTSNYVLPFDMLEPLDPAQEFCAETEKDLVSNSASTLEERERDFEGAFPHDTMAQWFLCHERLCECRAKMETALEKKMKDTDPSNEPDSEDDDESIPTDAHSRSSSEGSNIEAPYPIKKIADNPSPDAEVSPSSLPNTENLAKSESTGVTSSPQPENPNIRGGGHDFDPNYSSSPVKLDLNSVFDCEGPSLPPHPEASPLTLSSTSPGFADSPCCIVHHHDPRLGPIITPEISLREHHYPPTSIFEDETETIHKFWGARIPTFVDDDNENEKPSTFKYDYLEQIATSPHDTEQFRAQREELEYLERRHQSDKWLSTHGLGRWLECLTQADDRYYWNADNSVESLLDHCNEEQLQSWTLTQEGSYANSLASWLWSSEGLSMSPDEISTKATRTEVQGQSANHVSAQNYHKLSTANCSALKEREQVGLIGGAQGTAPQSPSSDQISRATRPHAAWNFNVLNKSLPPLANQSRSFPFLPFQDPRPVPQPPTMLSVSSKGRDTPGCQPAADKQGDSQKNLTRPTSQPQSKGKEKAKENSDKIDGPWVPPTRAGPSSSLLYIPIRPVGNYDSMLGHSNKLSEMKVGRRGV